MKSNLVANLKALGIFGVVALSLYSLALTYRYEPVAGSQTALGTISVWDRWNNRVCVVSIAKNNIPLCSVDDLARATVPK